ncbi:hypothetical protein GGR58DRAFT_518489 [Xylaria digitata]|nr:hypothetical protein GGR58DRAFT_518489 [Xylaria digitata]
MVNVPFEVFYVPLFHRKRVKYFEEPKCEVFIVKSTIQPYMKVKVWWTKEGHRKLEEIYETIPLFDENNCYGGFVNGRPMICPQAPIFTCAGPERPPILYRVVHEQQPHYGMKARGYGLVEVTPLLFQVLVDKHLNWQCRDPSPFISTTNRWGKIRQIINILHKRGCSGLRVVVFRSSGPGWDHKPSIFSRATSRPRAS